jgi:hydrogenase maturation factor
LEAVTLTPSVTGDTKVVDRGKGDASRQRAEDLLQAMHDHPLGREAAIIGEAVSDHRGKIALESRIGGARTARGLTRCRESW